MEFYTFIVLFITSTTVMKGKKLHKTKYNLLKTNSEIIQYLCTVPASYASECQSNCAKKFSGIILTISTPLQIPTPYTGNP